MMKTLIDLIVEQYERSEKWDFHELQPYKMDLEAFNKYIFLGEQIEEEKLEKLKNCEEPLLEYVINRIIETDLVIEQGSVAKLLWKSSERHSLFYYNF